MTARAIDKKDWAAFCDGVSRVLGGSNVEIEVDSLDLGSQIEREWAPWIGISYDPKDDVIEIALEEVDHLVNEPREMVVDLDDMEINALQITDGDGRRHLVRLRDGLLLPPPN
jgi:hypothetical protein